MRFSLRLKVRPEDIDAQNHVNNVVYLQWVQDVAVAHWRSLASPGMQDGLGWVAARHEIDYRRPAMPGDEILLETWVGPAGRRTFERRTEIFRAADHKLLAEAKTIWVPIDMKTGKATDVSDDIRNLFSTASEGAS